MAAMMRIVVVAALLAGCKGKQEKKPEPGSAVAPVAVAADAAIAVDAPPPKPTESTRNGPWGIDARTEQTVAKLATAGYLTQKEWGTDRAPLFTGSLVDIDDDRDIGVVAHMPEGKTDDPVAFYETYLSENYDDSKPRKDQFASAGLCVEGVCPYMPIADAKKLGIEKCATFKIEEVFRFKCVVPNTPLVVYAEGDVKGAKRDKEIAFDKLVAAKLDIRALAWESKPGAWQPLVGCSTDCD
jgi:hypothetical protein